MVLLLFNPVNATCTCVYMHIMLAIKKKVLVIMGNGSIITW